MEQKTGCVLTSSGCIVVIIIMVLILIGVGKCSCSAADTIKDRGIKNYANEWWEGSDTTTDTGE